MDNKKICCIADTDIKPKVMMLLEEIQSRINLTIPLLGDNDSVVEYEVVLFVLSNGAHNNPSIQTLLKEAFYNWKWIDKELVVKEEICKN